MPQANKSLIGSVFERNPSSRPPTSGTIFSSAGKTGFPTVQHRSKSAFARAREKAGSYGSMRPNTVPQVLSSSAKDPPTTHTPNNDSQTDSLTRVSKEQDPESWRQHISSENERIVEQMSEEEHAQERMEIVERFGTDVGDLLKRVKEARERKGSEFSEHNDSQLPIPLVSHTGSSSQIESNPSKSPVGSSALNHNTQTEAPLIRNHSPPSPRPILSSSSTRPSSRTDRKIRFAEVMPENVHYYESAPPSPRKKILALPPPPDVSEPGTISLGQWKGNLPDIAKFDSLTPGPNGEEGSLDVQMKAGPEEGSPEDIRQRFFPNISAHNPSVAWIESSSTLNSTPDTLRFDLTGTTIPIPLLSTLPTHLGLHHHAEGTHAGYTLDDIFLLSRSSVPAQRATMLDLLSRIAHKLGKGQEGIAELEGREEEIRKRMVAAGVEAMGERGSLGAQAIRLVWECLSRWDEYLLDVEGMELKDDNGVEDVISTLPLDFVLPQVTTLFVTSSLPAESMSQLLAVIYRLAQHSNVIATTIVETPNLVANVIRTFLLSPIPQTRSSSLPDPFALRVLDALARSSRANASALVDPADALLRFVTVLPSNSPYPTPLATALLTATLQLYTTLASYGLYSHVTTIASSYFLQISDYVLSDECRSKRLIQAWASLLEAWIVCATDPHRTTPNHDILWSQVVGWGWGKDILAVTRKLTVGEHDRSVWSTVWRAEAAWLEGCSINAVMNGSREKFDAMETLRRGFDSGIESQVVLNSGTELQQGIDAFDPSNGIDQIQSLARHATTLASAMRLWISCLPPLTDGSLVSPPFPLPFPLISVCCAKLVSHIIWSPEYINTLPSHALIFYRPLTLFLSIYLRFSHRLPATTDDLWMAQAFSIVTKLLPGDEEAGLEITSQIFRLITGNLLTARGWRVLPEIWDKGGMNVLTPFLTYILRPDNEVYIGPSQITPQSISSSTTLRIPCLHRSAKDAGLPLTTGWMLSPVNDLLRSGTSPVFKNLPTSWNASEVDVVRASLLLAKVSRGVLDRYSMTDFLMSRSQTVFACMKVFMLEHEQPHNDSQEEVFRDGIVGQFMSDLLGPFTLAASPAASEASDDLEKVATSFLGPSTPFYQYYTDFVSLFDAVSFSHPLFARLLLPPTSMKYAIDYRKYLWNDFGHILKNIRTPPNQLIAKSIGEYLWPVEDDPQMLSLYLRALVKGSVDESLRLIAIHHIACNIWPDLHNSNNSEDKAHKLLSAIVDQGGLEVIRDVTLYRQDQEGPSLLPPTCFQQEGDWKSSRFHWLGENAQLTERLRGLLQL